MSRMMIQAAVTMNELQKKLDLIGNNLANSETTGYKNRQAEFSSLLFQQINNLKNTAANEQGRLTPNGVRVGSGAKLGAVHQDLSVGSFKQTGRLLDTALLHKNHYFQISVVENGVEEIHFTRDGSFYLHPTADGNAVMLVTKDGHPVLGQNGPIAFADGFDEIVIQANGEIQVVRGQQTESVGTLAVIEARQPHLFEATGANNFRLPNLAELDYNEDEIIQIPIENELIKSGVLENSNVDITKQITDLLLTQRSYQFNARTISMSDQMLGLINQLR